MRAKIAKKTTLIFILCAVVVTGALAVISKGYTDFDVHSWVNERNPDNLIDYKFGVNKHINGVDCTIDEHGVIHLEGFLHEKIGSNGKPVYIQWGYTLGQMVLPAGRYTLSCEGNVEGACAVFMEYNDSTGKLKGVSSWVEQTIEFTEPTLVKFYARVIKSGNVNYTLYPVLTNGANPVDFYVKKSVGR